MASGIAASSRQKQNRSSRIRQIEHVKRISHCERPENVDGPSPEAWDDINAHLGTRSQYNSVGRGIASELWKTPRVGDSFCGGGSILLKLLYREAYGSDLNQLLATNWASQSSRGGKEI